MSTPEPSGDLIRKELKSNLQLNGALQEQLASSEAEIERLILSDPLLVDYLSRMGDDTRASLSARRYTRPLLGVLALAAAGGGYLSAQLGTEPIAKLPSVALQSPLLLHIERVSAGMAILAILGIFAVRAWEGVLPRQVSTAGAEWEPRSVVAQAIATGDETKIIDKELRSIAAANAKAIKALGEDLDEIKRRIDELSTVQ